MGRSARAVLALGFYFDEDGMYELPWNDTEYDGIEDWWIKGVYQWKPTVEVWTDDGDYLPGFNRNSPEVDQYFVELRSFRQQMIPELPVQVEALVSYDYQECILAVKDKVYTADWDKSTPIAPDSLEYSEYDKRKLLDFCERFEIDVEPLAFGWKLGAFYG